MVFIVELEQPRRHAFDLQRRVIFLGLRHRRPAIEDSRHQQRRRGHLADRHQRRVREPVAGIVPERLLEKTVGEERDVGVPGHADPVDDGTTHGRRGEPIGLANHPARKDAAAAAARDVHPRRLDVAPGDDRVDAGHQVVIVGPGVVVIDPVAEGAAVPGAAARVDKQHHEIIGGKVLKHPVERDVVHRERSAMDFKDQRILLRRIERRRLDDPALDLGVGARRVPQLLGFRDLFAGEHVAVDIGEAGNLCRLAQVHPRDVLRVFRIGQRSRRNEIARDGIERQHVRASRHRSDAAGEGGELDVPRTAIVGIEIHAAVVRRPDQIVRITVVVAADLAHRAAGDRHDEQITRRMGVAGRLVAGEGDQLAVGRDHRFAPGSRFHNEVADRAAGDIHDVQLRSLVFEVGIAVAVAVKHDRLAVGRQGARRTALGRHHEQVRVAVLEEADAILPVMERVDDARRRRPLRAFRLGRHTDGPFLLLRLEHRKRDRLAVRRPADAARRLQDVGDLRGRTGGVDPAHKHLRPFRLALGHVQQPLPVRRPPRGGTLDEEAMFRAVALHHPGLRLPFVLDLVHMFARIDDARAVGRDLRIAHPFPVQVMLCGQQSGRARLLTTQPDAPDHGNHQRDDNTSHGILLSCNRSCGSGWVVWVGVGPVGRVAA